MPDLVTCISSNCEVHLMCIMMLKKTVPPPYQGVVTIVVLLHLQVCNLSMIRHPSSPAFIFFLPRIIASVSRLVVAAAGAASGKFISYHDDTKGVGAQTAYGVEVEVRANTQAS